MSLKGYRWAYNPKTVHPHISDAEKARVKELCDLFIDAELKPKYLIKYNERHKDQKMKEIYSKWYRGFLHFIAVYKDFRKYRILDLYKDRFARLEYLDEDKFLLSYFRHTNEWFELTYGKGVSLEIALRNILEMPHFIPM